MDLVGGSPRAVADHDRELWLALFAPGAVVEDPVGSAPVVKGADLDPRTGLDALGRFWETFVADNVIRFEVHEDLVAPFEAPGSSAEVEAWVVRDVSIHTTVPGGYTVVVPAYLVYEAGTDSEGRKVLRRMAAHWALPTLSIRAMSGGLGPARSMTALFGRMLRVGGARATLGFLRAMHDGVFLRGRRAATAFAEATTSGALERLRGLLATDEACLEWPVGRRLEPDAFLEARPAGARLQLDRPISAGWVTVARYSWLSPGSATLKAHPRPSRGVVFFFFEPGTARIRRARFVPSEGTERGSRPGDPGAGSRAPLA